VSLGRILILTLVTSFVAVSLVIGIFGPAGVLAPVPAWWVIWAGCLAVVVVLFVADNRGERRPVFPIELIVLGVALVGLAVLVFLKG
jgi:hypothetical protein